MITLSHFRSLNFCFIILSLIILIVLQIRKLVDENSELTHLVRGSNEVKETSSDKFAELRSLVGVSSC